MPETPQQRSLKASNGRARRWLPARPEASSASSSPRPESWHRTQPDGEPNVTNILIRILATKAKEIASAKAARPYIRVRAAAEALPPPRDFVGALRSRIAAGEPAVI